MFTWTFQHRFMSAAPRFRFGGESSNLSHAGKRLAADTAISVDDAQMVANRLGYSVGVAVVTYAKSVGLDPMTLARASKGWDR